MIDKNPRRTPQKRYGTSKEVVNKPEFKITKGFVIPVLIIICLIFSVYIVPAGHRGIVTTFGSVDLDAKNEGLHFRIPFAQGFKNMDVRTTKLEVTADAASADLQDVQTTLALNYHLNPSQTPNLYQEIGKDFEERIIQPAIQEAVKAVSAQYTAEELITRRSEVKQDTKELLYSKLSNFYITVDEVNIVNFQFSEEYDKAIEEKVTAEQRRLKAEIELEIIKVEKQQTIARAEAKAEELRLQKTEITPMLIEYKQIEAQLAWIAKWNGVQPYVTGGSTPIVGMNSLFDESMG